MANAIEVKKEINTLTAECLILRRKKTELISDVRKGRVAIEVVDADKEKAKAQCNSERNSQKILVKQTRDLIEDIKTRKRNIVIAEGELKKSQDDISAREALADNKEQKNNKDFAKLTDSQNSFKQTKIDHEENVSYFENEKTQFYAGKEINSQELAYNIDAALKREKELLAKIDKLNAGISETNTLNDELANSRAMSREKIKRLSDSISQNKTLEKELKAENIKAEQEQTKAKDEQVKATALQKSFTSQLAELNNTKKEIQLLELKVKKLIRDNNLDKELKKALKK